MRYSQLEAEHGVKSLEDEPCMRVRIRVRVRVSISISISIRVRVRVELRVRMTTQRRQYVFMRERDYTETPVEGLDVCNHEGLDVCNHEGLDVCNHEGLDVCVDVRDYTYVTMRETIQG